MLCKEKSERINLNILLIILYPYYNRASTQSGEEIVKTFRWEHLGGARTAPMVVRICMYIEYVPGMYVYLLNCT